MKTEIKQERQREIAEKARIMFSELDERQRRLWAASEARAIGHGGIVLVARATGMDRRAIMRGIREMEERESLPEGRRRKIGGG